MITKFDKVDLYEVVVVENYTREYCYGRAVAEKMKRYLHSILDNVTIEVNHLTSDILVDIQEEG